MDLNQRFMYPQIVRSGRHDSAVFGTSTVRLLDPRELDMLFAARFAKKPLDSNAGTPWSGMQLAALFLRQWRLGRKCWCSASTQPGASPTPTASA